MKRELAVGDSLARFGSGGGRFTTLALISVSLSLSLARSISLSHSLARSQSPSHSLSLARSQSPSHTHLSGLGHAARSFDGGIEGSEPHHTREPFLLGSRISAANFPQGRRRTPKLDQREKKIKKKKKSLQEFAGFQPDFAGIRQGIAGITVD
jgi:hypothetical protein